MPKRHKKRAVNKIRLKYFIVSSIRHFSVFITKKTRFNIVKELKKDKKKCIMKKIKLK